MYGTQFSASTQKTVSRDTAVCHPFMVVLENNTRVLLVRLNIKRQHEPSGTPCSRRSPMKDQPTENLFIIHAHFMLFISSDYFVKAACHAGRAG